MIYFQLGLRNTSYARGKSDECVVADTIFKCVRLEFIQLFERGWVGIRITKLLLVFLFLKKKDVNSSRISGKPLKL